MTPTPKHGRSRDRAYVEPYTTNTFLEFTLSGATRRCPLLDVAPGGFGILVSNKEREVLQHLRPGTRMSMVYTSPEATMPMDFEIRHITEIQRGDFTGHFQIGLRLVSETK